MEEDIVALDGCAGCQEIHYRMTLDEAVVWCRSRVEGRKMLDMAAQEGRSAVELGLKESIASVPPAGTLIWPPVRGRQEAIL